MKIQHILLALTMVCLLAACQAPLPPLNIPVDTEFTLAREQSATIKKTKLTITFNSVISDDRCPIDVECVTSGAVTISLSVQESDRIPSGLTLQTLTDQEGRAGAEPIGGNQATAEVGAYIIRVVGVQPYPRNLSGIKPSDYEVTLLVTEK